MKHIKKIFLIILIIPAILFSCLSSSGLKEGNLDSGKVQLIIEPEYDEYLLNQSVWIKVVLKNLSNNSYYIKRALSNPFLDFKILDPSGNKVHCGITYTYGKARDSILLSPEDSVLRYECLDIYMATQNNIQGIYKIYANYQGIKSNEIEIMMLEPTGIDKEVYNSTYRTRTAPWTLKEISHLSNIIDSYPESKYMPQLYSILLGILVYKEKDIYNKFMYYFNKYFENHSNSYNSLFVIGEYDGYLKDRKEMSIEQVKKEVKNLSSRYKNTVFEQLVNIYIQRKYSGEKYY